MLDRREAIKLMTATAVAIFVTPTIVLSALPTNRPAIGTEYYVGTWFNASATDDILVDVTQTQTRVLRRACSDKGVMLGNVRTEMTWHPDINAYFRLVTAEVTAVL